MKQKMPRRKSSLELTELEDELVCYEQGAERAFCLNATAGLVLKHCDGETDREHVAGLLGEDPSSRDLLEFTLKELRKEGLLEDEVEKGMTRAEFFARWGAVAAALPVIASISVPTPADAQSGPVDGPCTDSPCIDGVCICCTQCICLCAPPPP